MKNLNNVILIGNLVREPEIKYSPSGVCICVFDIANNNSYLKGNETVESVSYFQIKCFGTIAQNVGKFLHKGSQVAVCGQLKQDRWEDKTTGKTVSKIYVLAVTIEFLSKKSDEKPQTQKQVQNQKSSTTQTNNLNPWADQDDMFENAQPPEINNEDMSKWASDDEIPF